MNSISFWTPVDFGNSQRNCWESALEFVDDYFYLGGEKAVVQLSGPYADVVMAQGEANWVATALKVITYSTGIIPLILLVAKVVLRCAYEFRVIDKQEVVVVKDGIETFVKPKLIFEDITVGKIQINFAEVEIDGEKQLVALQRAIVGDFQHGDWMRYEGSPAEALLSIAQDNAERWMPPEGRHRGAPIDRILKDPLNTIIPRDAFLRHLFEANAKGTPWIFTLNEKSFSEMLRLAKTGEIVIDLQTKDPVSQKTLFTKWAGQGYKYVTESMLQLDPTAALQTDAQGDTPFAKAVLTGVQEEADVQEEAEMLLAAMKEQGVVLSEKDVWICRAFTGDCGFEDAAFTTLDPELKSLIYRVANMYMREALVMKLNGLGMGSQEPLWFAHPGLDVVAPNMDCITARESIQAFLTDLRRQGLLMTKEEFSQLDQSKYMSKTAQVGRILGRDFIERTAKKLGLTHIKAPKKVAVIELNSSVLGNPEPRTNVAISVVGSFELKSQNLEIYAERITSVRRTVSREEMSELLTLLAAVRYSDFLGDNLMIAQDGIYIIDTEFHNFRFEPEYLEVDFSGWMAEEDREWFRTERAARTAAYQQTAEQQKLALKAHREVCKDLRLKFGFKGRQTRFVFELPDILGNDSVPDDAQRGA